MATLFIAGCAPRAGLGPSDAELERAWKAGETLPIEATAEHPLPELEIENDTGINVLIDLAHQCSFAMMWGMPPELEKHGFRPVGSHATLDTVLTPGTPSRVRIPVGRKAAVDTLTPGDPSSVRLPSGGYWPFAWWPNPKYNVVITHQGGPESQDYLPEEREALKKFVEAGGGLVIVGWAHSDEKLETWTLNLLAQQFGAGFTSKTDKVGDIASAVLELGPAWESVEQGADGGTVVARGSFGKGGVVLVGSFALINVEHNNPDELKAAKRERLGEIMTWAAAGSEPAGGEPRLPDAMWGGGGIYPELEQRVGSLVVYYARNQKEHLLKTVRDDLPAVGKQLQAWLPSRIPEEPMFLILAAGGGGGWAVNAYEPKEIGVISLERLGVISIFAHELAHTMAGPPNDDGVIAANWSQGNQGESHAGWFQGKIVAKYTDDKLVKGCNRLFDFDAKGDALDLAAPPDELRKKWGGGKEWTKIWWVFQKLDDRYGPTWYPRWRWVQHTRWADTPDKKLTWDEMIEDMSIAVGEDLFPFFTKIGTTLKRDRLESIEFQDETLELPVADIEVTPAGEAKLGKIGDYKKPLTPTER